MTISRTADALGRVCWTRRAQSRQRKPTNLSLRRQSEARELRRGGCMGAINSSARSVAAKSQTNLVLSVRPASFTSAAPRKLAGLTAISGCLAGRSLAAFEFFSSGGRARAVPDGLASLRPSERNGAAAQLVKRTEGEWAASEAQV